MSLGSTARIIASAMGCLGAIVAGCGGSWERAAEDESTSPHAGATRARLDSAELITDANEHLVSVLRNDGGVAGGAFFEFVPIEPPTIPPQAYPEGTVISGKMITIPGGPMRVWFDVNFGGWGGLLRTVQGTMDGVNGFVSGDGDSLTRTMPIPCTEFFEPEPHATCAAEFGPGSSCKSTDFVNGQCEAGAWQDTSRSDYALGGGSISVADGDRDNMRWGATQNYSAPCCADPGTRRLLGTGALDVPPGASGVYVIPFVGAGTFMTLTTGGDVRYTTNPLVIDIPVGTCCYTLESLDAECVDGVTRSQCSIEYPQPSGWFERVSCDDFVCEPLLGACCDRATGTCSVTTRDECLSADDALVGWQGGTSCDEVECQPALGACCDPVTGFCSQTARADCPGIGEPEFAWLIDSPCEVFSCPSPYEPIPTVSQWGLVVMTLLLLTGAKVYFGRRPSSMRE